MTCNYMNEACDGGWPHFNVFLAENAHLVAEDCAPYKGKTKGAKNKCTISGIPIKNSIITRPNKRTASNDD